MPGGIFFARAALGAPRRKRCAPADVPPVRPANLIAMVQSVNSGDKPVLIASSTRRPVAQHGHVAAARARRTSPGSHEPLTGDTSLPSEAIMTSITRTTQPEKQAVRSFLARQRALHAPPLAPEQIRQQLGWWLIPANGRRL